MVILAYILGFISSHGWWALGGTAALFFLWGGCASDKSPAALRIISFPLGFFLLLAVVALGFYTLDMKNHSDGKTGELIAAHGEPAKIELVTKTGSSRTVGRRSSASIHYDVIYRYADGSTVNRNIDILDIPATKEGWEVIVESKVYDVRCLPGLKEACSVIGKAA